MNQYVFKGFKFGMLLQLAVGPMCVLVFKTSASSGFLSGLILVLAIALVDAIYIALSGLGIAALINNAKAKFVMKLIGAVVLVLFGMNMVLSEFDILLLPALLLVSGLSNQNVFIQGLLLTASNPLTIIFWSGVFSAQVIENGLTRSQLVLFAIGCILSTLSFMTVVSLLGSFINTFLPVVVMQILNVIVGLVLIYFGIRLLLNKRDIDD